MDYQIIKTYLFRVDTIYLIEINLSFLIIRVFKLLNDKPSTNGMHSVCDYLHKDYFSNLNKNNKQKLRGFKG